MKTPFTYGTLYIVNLLFQFSYKKSLIFEGENTHCCQSLPLSCRQHCERKLRLSTGGNVQGEHVLIHKIILRRMETSWSSRLMIFGYLCMRLMMMISRRVVMSLLVAKSLTIRTSKLLFVLSWDSAILIAFSCNFQQLNVYRFEGTSEPVQSAFSSLFLLCGVLNLLFKTKRDFLHGHYFIM